MQAGTKIPYISDCTKYILCPAFGDGTVLDCPSAEHFSPTLKDCTDPALAGCPDCSIITTTLAVTGSTPDPYCSFQPHCTTETTGSTLPYITDCTKYIYCPPFGEETILTCPNSEHYSPTLTKCTDPATAQCPVCL
ncbi:hypothetical protein B566_EDAN012164 [Ephemera danica]|nr:hypothetical protein B566_EDAN012164 [Ephemera danica]